MFGITLEQLQFILRGAGWTLLLSSMGFLGGAALGLPLALARSRGGRVLRSATGILIQLAQGIPLPVLMFLCYFGISIAGFNLPSLVAAGLAMTMYSGAFLAEIWKACIQAVSRTQWEAAECLALRPLQRLRYVVLPQAARIAVAPTVGFLVQIVKNSSYAVVIGFFDLTYSARVVNNSTFEPFAVFSIAAALYFAICYPLSVLSYRLEKRLKRA
ncbi:amino acid ABC transporter permease [Burkholderia multivorans]|uniref:amino acid ABC transporter permease n=1 Tax=Burkholderia multivorans TaxID=87883 RepID=UPI001C23132D|nr:amino acid ABC transporter permease [Burkholderia multivorans]MBU9604750.1 amino acid ABC transporter permease [Burkholderia multivorans]MBU9622379.1 amino acid ABC transporter permease [Burkholderia multivorans]